MSDVNYTYETMAEKEADKAQLVRLLDAIDATPNALKLDDCECWQIRGRFGYAATWGDGKGFMLVFSPGRSARQWGADKQRLSFAAVTQDGHAEGILHLDRLPTEEQGAAIRHALGIHQRKRFSEAHRAWLSEHMKGVRP